MSSNHDLMQDLQQWECRDSTYQAAEPPLVFARARGSRIWDADGREFIDLCAGFGVAALGHNNAIQHSVFKRSFDDESAIIHGMGDVYPSVDKIQLLEYLGQLLPSSLSKGALALSGGQAVEIAVKTAQLATGKSGFIAFAGAYHGLDLGILPLTSRQDFKAPFLQWMPSHLVSEVAYGCEMSVIEDAIVQQAAAGYGTAAVIVEPIQGRAGIRLPPQGWLKSLSDLCRQQNVLLIFDEIFTGLGRIGSLSTSYDIDCDLICLGKALGGGMPLSACFGREEVMNAWPKNQGEAIHTGTFFGHPLTCRLGLATLKHIAAHDLMGRSLTFGARMVSDLRSSLGSSPLLRDVRGQGMMIGVELTEKGLGALYMDRLRSLGVIALASGLDGEGISLTPALTLSESDWLDALPRLAEGLYSLST